MDVKSSDICRLCVSLLTDKHELFSKTEGVDFPNLIKKYIFIEITEQDILPLAICNTCMLMLTSIEDYASKCLENQKKLLEMLFPDAKVADMTQYSLEDGLVKIEPMEDVKHEEEYFDFGDSGHFDDNDDVDETVHFRRTRNSIQKIVTKIKAPKKRKKRNKVKKTTTKTKPTTKQSPEGQKQMGRPPSSMYKLVNFDCHICEEKFEVFQRLYHHTTTHHKEKPKVLCVCKQYIDNYSSLSKHLRSHSRGEKALRYCAECSISFTSIKLYDRHMLSVHSKPPEFLCGLCGMIFHQKSRLKYHTEKRHLPKELTHIHRCDKCDKMFKFARQLEMHSKTVHNNDGTLTKSACEVCGVQVLDYKLKAHVRNHKIRMKGLQCPHCPAKFQRQKNYKAHVESLHLGLRYKCIICSQIFKSYVTLKNHYVVHSDVHKYNCRHCDKKFKRPSDRKMHENRHLGLQPYECPWCHKKFGDNSHLRNHKKTQHPKELAEYEAIHGPPKNGFLEPPVKKDLDPDKIMTIPLSKNERKMLEAV